MVSSAVALAFGDARGLAAACPAVNPCLLVLHSQSDIYRFSLKGCVNEHGWISWLYTGMRINWTDLGLVSGTSMLLAGCGILWFWYSGHLLSVGLILMMLSHQRRQKWL